MKLPWWAWFPDRQRMLFSKLWCAPAGKDSTTLDTMSREHLMWTPRRSLKVKAWAARSCRVRGGGSDDGLLVFDHWYGPAVLTDRPTPRIKTFENDEVKIIRIATPTLFVNDNLVNVRYDLSIVEKSSGRCNQIVENHRMRYLFWPEIESLLLSNKAPDQSSWNTFVAATALAEPS